MSPKLLDLWFQAHDANDMGEMCVIDGKMYCPVSVIAAMRFIYGVFGLPEENLNAFEREGSTG